MIKFRYVRWKNFLSTGDAFTELQLDRSPSTLIVGHNGSGKSTLLDALSFGLFGKPHRSINKMQLINSINNKGTVVEVEFEVGVHSFKIVRAIKPNKFEIWQNGNMINQSAKVRDYQKFLEQNILKLNHKSFHQIVVLGSSSFIPFMQLPTAQRRDVIEDLLDIQVFSKMNYLLKEKDKALKGEILDTNYRIDLLKEKVNIQRKYIRDITELNEEQIKEKQLSINMYSKEVTDMHSTNTILSDKIVSLNVGLDDKFIKARSKRDKLLEYKVKFEQQIRSVVKDAKFYTDNETCPTCTQDIAAELKAAHLTSAQDKAVKLKVAVADVANESLLIETKLLELNDIMESVRTNNNSLSNNNTQIASLQKLMSKLENEIVTLTSKNGDVGVANEELTVITDDKDATVELKLRLLEEQSYNTAAGEMLKDTGIKTKVIKQYLPVMNKLINNYLQILDFFVSFNLDESFNESIRSRHRDSFNYASFSEGEKQRIDLALLFTWRQIAKMKNSASTNLLVLDETFDSSLDVDGVDNLTKILDTLDTDSNVFIISHKGDMLENKFRNKIEFYKDRNFSKLK